MGEVLPNRDKFMDLVLFNIYLPLSNNYLFVLWTKLISSRFLLRNGWSTCIVYIMFGENPNDLFSI